MDISTYNIINCPCLAYLNIEEARTHILDIVLSKKGGYTAAINALKIVKYNKEKETKDIIDKSVLQTPDGFGAIYGFKLLHKKKVIKLDLPGLVLDIAHENKLKMFFLGTSEENNSLAVEKVKTQYPGIEITDRNNGFFKSIDEISKKLNQNTPDIVMIAMGSPRQEMISAELHKMFPEILFVGCGGRLDILAGKLKRAPEFYIKWNIEWLYRLIKQPKRIKQQLGLITYLFMLYKCHWFKRK